MDGESLFFGVIIGWVATCFALAVALVIIGRGAREQERIQK